MVQSLVKEITIDAAQLGVCAYAIFALATIVHESGHAVAASNLYTLNHFPDIHIGSTNPQNDQDKKLFSLGRFHFYKNLIWTSGQTNYNFMYGANRDSSLKDALITAAGGASAALLLYALITSITTYCSLRDDYSFEGLKKGLINSFSPFKTIINARNLTHPQKRFFTNAVLIIGISLFFNIFYGLTPSPIFRGDGSYLWEDLIGLKGIPLKAFQGLSVVGMYGSWLWLVKKFYDTQKQLWTDYRDAGQNNELLI